MKTQHESLMDDPEFRKLLSVEALAAEASELIARLMHEQSVTKADLARRLDKSRAWVTQLLSGKANMTVRTLAEVAHALEAEVKLHAEPAQWKINGKPKGGGWQPVVFRMGGYELRPAVKADDLFHLDDHEMKFAGDDIAPAEDDPVRPGYAA